MPFLRNAAVLITIWGVVMGQVNNLRADDVARKATFAGGCFWCMEAPFEKLNGVIEVTAGYTGGQGEDPVYEDYGRKGHLEAVEVKYDPLRITYSELLDVFWRQVDPTDSGGQFADRGPYYRPAIFYHDDEQKKLAEESKAALEDSGRFKGKIAVEIIQASKFYKAEDYHQDYYKSYPVRYKIYRFNSGRDRFLKKAWAGREYSGLSKKELQERLTPLQYKVTQEGGTEPAFKNEYWDNTREGIYVDIVSGEPLFSSGDKFKSGTGWPSFTKPLEPGNITRKEDKSFFMKRTEVRSKKAGSHLGHLFKDGPPPEGNRYCINSAALRFIPKEDLIKEGYGEYRKLFKEEREGEE